MLKTQLSKAFYLCLFGLIICSFMPVSHSVAVLSNEGVNREITFIADARATAVAPKVKLNKQALQFASHYIRTSSEDLISIKKRSKAPFSIMDAVFAKYGLPVELKYLAVIESELKTTALSHVGALGPWQLMPETAQDLGLKITSQYDERTNYAKSTKAAALYLRDLYGKFGDWLLVLAAYNAGPRPVLNAIHQSGSKNFWALQNFLPAETRGHVKRFIATHYYFEGHGSVTTLTRSENAEYGRALSAFTTARSIARLATAGIRTIGLPKGPAPKWSPAYAGGNTIGLFYKASYNLPGSTSDKESPQQHFERMMNESEKSLQKSNKAIVSYI